MKRIYNFAAGPCTLPLPALEEAAAEFVDYKGQGMSIIEMSHRGKAYEEVHHGAMDTIRELLGLGREYKILFLGGGATLQFAMIPMNFLADGQTAEYTVTGSWAKLACKDASKLGKVRVIYDGEANRYTELPDPKEMDVDPSAAYVHITSNETIGGIEWQSFPDTGSVPLVCDMSSDFLSRPIPTDKFAMIYAGAQKNAGPAGVTIAIIREDLLARCPDSLPAYLNYNTHAPQDSLYNTPPVFPIYMLGKVVAWLKENGGLEGAQKMANERAALIYGAIAKSGGYYKSPIAEKYRSKMNIVFRLPSEELEAQFIKEAAENGMSGLKGHRSVGGCRASCYNAMPIEGARALASFMASFAEKNG